MNANKILMMHSLNEEDQKPNPVVERVKMIMIAGLSIVHAHRYTREIEIEMGIYSKARFPFDLGGGKEKENRGYRTGAVLEKK